MRQSWRQAPRSIRRIRAVLLGLLALLPTLAASPAATTGTLAHGAFRAFPHSTGPALGSLNWAGYADLGATFDQVRGSWVQPDARCDEPGFHGASFWVGLDGIVSSSVEQVGTEVDCSGGAADSFAWFEMFPSPPVRMPLDVRPGDRVSAQVEADGTSFELRIDDLTSGRSFTQHAESSAPRSSAEWIVEAPVDCGSSGCAPVPLTNFGSVTVAPDSVRGDGHEGPINGKRWSDFAIVMVNPLGQVKAQTSALFQAGHAFEVDWQRSS
jgi:hypothetical protein